MSTRRSALVTGGSSGIGAAVAAALAGSGYRVVVLGRDGAALDAVARRTGARPVVADLAADTGLGRAAEIASGVDLLVNAAGRGLAADLAETGEAEIGALVTLNLTAALVLTRAAVPGMRERDHGHLAFVSSIAAVGVAGEAVYAATKAGLRGFAAAVRLEVAGSGIGVTTLLPGAVRTPFFERRGRPYARRLPRPVEPEVAAAALLRAVHRDAPEVFVPQWLSLAARVHGAMPATFQRLARRFG